MSPSGNTKFKQVKFFLNIWNLFVTIIWWNFFIQLFIGMQFLIRIDSNIDVGTSKAILILRDSFSTSTLIITGFVVFQWLTDKYIFERFRSRNSLSVTFLFQLISFLLVFSVMAFFIGLYYYSAIKGLNPANAIYYLNTFTFNPTVLFLLITGIMIKFSLVFIFEVQRRLGYGMFWKFVIGHYKKPKEENRIFIFIDLVSSTECSEKLGHVKYSEFLQECFYIMGSTIVNTKGYIYQYVGDEVIISWEANKPRNFLRAIDFLYLYNDEIHRKKNFFLKEFGIVPQFTASLNSGKIMVAEVGFIKSEVAYHGSVLNTAARLQKQCRTYNAKLLATENFIKNIKIINADYSFTFLDEVQFAGKQKKEQIFKIDRTS